MNRRLRKLSDTYAALLRRYLAAGHESVMQEVYEMGRAAFASGLGVLDVARAHQEALGEILPATPLAGDRQRECKAAADLFFELLSPFEVTHRGFRETISRLSQLNAALTRRNLDLRKEIDGRRLSERALRESERHQRGLVAEARQMEEDLRHLSNKILHTQEEERRRISRELHDEIGQALTALGMTLASLNHGGGAAASDQRLAGAQQVVQETMETVHRFARELRPVILDELGLLSAFRSHLKAFARRTGLRIQFQGSQLAEKLSGERKLVLFRVAQESLTNVAKHAGATRVRVALRQAGGCISLEIADNGRSFREAPGPSARRPSRLGLLGMRERVRLVNGRFEVLPRPGLGTTIRVAVPLNSAAAGRLRRNGAATRADLVPHPAPLKS